MNTRIFSAYGLSVFAAAVVLLWIGLFKFTPAEAAAIKPLVNNHFAMRWLYGLLSVQGVSNLIGLSEIAVGAGLIASFWWPAAGRVAGLAAGVIFVVTLSFLFTTPGLWRWINGFPVTDFFILKDLGYLGIALMVWERNRR